MLSYKRSTNNPVFIFIHDNKITFNFQIVSYESESPCVSPMNGALIDIMFRFGTSEIDLSF